MNYPKGVKSGVPERESILKIHQHILNHITPMNGGKQINQQQSTTLLQLYSKLFGKPTKLALPSRNQRVYTTTAALYGAGKKMTFWFLISMMSMLLCMILIVYARRHPSTLINYCFCFVQGVNGRRPLMANLHFATYSM